MNTPRESLLTVTGTGRVRVSPDRVVVHIELDVLKPTSELAEQECAARRAAVLDALSQAHVPRERIRSSGVALAPRYHYEHERRVFSGIGATESISVRVPHAPGRANEIVRALAAELPRLNVRVQHLAKDVSDARKQALAAAVADARQQAEAIAEAAGSNLDRIHEITEGGDDRRIFQQIGTVPDGTVHDDVSPHEIVIETTVKITWSISPLE